MSKSNCYNYRGAFYENSRVAMTSKYICQSEVLSICYSRR